MNITGITVPGFNLQGNTIGDIIGLIIPIIISVAGIFLIFYLVLGGLDLMLSAGDPKKIAGGRGKITYAIIGILVTVFAYFVVQLIGKIFGISQIQDIFS